MPGRRPAIWFRLAMGVLAMLSLTILAGPGWADDGSCYFRLIKQTKPSVNNLSICIENQQRLYDRHSATEEGAKYLFRLARLNELYHSRTGKRSNLDSALAQYRLVTTQYSKSNLADDALFHIGSLLEGKKGDQVGAYVEYLRIEVVYPKSDMADEAKQARARLAGQIKQAESRPLVSVEPNGSKSSEVHKTPQVKLAVLTDKSSSKHRTVQKIAQPAVAFEPPTVEPPRKTNGKLSMVTGLRYWSASDYTRIVIDTTNPVRFTSHMLRPDPNLGKPARLYLDVDDAKLGPQGEQVISIANGQLQRARMGQYDANTVRIVLDIEDIGGYKAFRLVSPNRLVVDVSGPKVASSRSQSQNKPSPILKGDPNKGKGHKLPRGRAKEEKGKGLAAQLGLGVRTIVIDPGHGGRDPGTRTCRNIKEKTITMKVAQKLAAKLRKNLGLRVIMTRTRDIYVPLEERTAIANTNQADLFISIHVNAARRKRLNGVETYFLNLATDERAITLAARENATSTKSISDLQSILNDLMLATKINESNRLAFQTQRSLVGYLRRAFPKTGSLGVKQAPFYVLLGARMPAILVEVGFGTNPTECYRLGKDRYQERLAEGLYNGIAAYVRQTGQKI